MSSEANVQSRISALEKILHQDPGKRGLQGIWDELLATGQLEKLYTMLPAAKSIANSCNKAIVCTGFVLPVPKQPETDGPPGALAICRLLHFLGRQVSLITAPGNSKLLESAIAFEKLRYGYDIPLIVAPLISDTPNPEEWAKGIIEGVDHVISIEILGASKSGAYFNMRGIDATEFNSPIDFLFNVNRDKTTTISIGDGGNEIGMGNLSDLVAKHVPRGEIICSCVKCDFLITAGVSNWGGYALACATYAYLKSTGKSADKRILPDVEYESDLLDDMLKNGALDGPTMTESRKVDSLDFDYHANLIREMVSIADSS